MLLQQRVINHALHFYFVTYAVVLKAGAIREVGEMRRNMADYKKDHWNIMDLLGLGVVSSGFLIRCADPSNIWGRSMYALGAPLIFARILFFAQILPFQGPLIQASPQSLEGFVNLNPKKTSDIDLFLFQMLSI